MRRTEYDSIPLNRYAKSTADTKFVTMHVLEILLFLMAVKRDSLTLVQTERKQYFEDDYQKLHVCMHARSGCKNNTIAIVRVLLDPVHHTTKNTK